MSQSSPPTSGDASPKRGDAYAIITVSTLSAVCFVCLFLTPDATIDNLPAIELINGVLLISFGLTSVISILLAAVRWKRIPTRTRVVPFVPVSAFLLLWLLFKLGTPCIGAEIKYAGIRDHVAIDFSHGWGASGFAMKKDEVWKDADVGRATDHYKIEVRDDYGAPVARSLTIDMTKEVPMLGLDRVLLVTITDDDIKYEVRVK